MGAKKIEELDLQSTIAVLRRLGFKVEFPEGKENLDEEYERYKNQYKNSDEKQ